MPSLEIIISDVISLLFPLVSALCLSTKLCLSIALHLISRVVNLGEPYVPVFQLPNKPQELRQECIKALHRENVAELKHIFVCVDHSRYEDIERVYKVPNLDGTYEEIPLGQPRLLTEEIPTILTAWISYYSIPSAPILLLSLDSKEEEQFTKAMQASHTWQMAEENTYQVETLKDLKLWFTSLNLPSNWQS